MKEASQFRFDFGTGLETVRTNTSDRKLAVFNHLATFVESIDEIERHVGVRPGSFFYPYGFRKAAGARELVPAAKVGFVATVTTRAGIFGSKMAG